ncbi:unnamed protein product [Linum tenue]|uniref:TF-B3 domain-containing protein n=1 Tax=Linum tenue TaxID=586396 RepID=A0AAV0MKT9_9ROSI|nr:unnamed protein product [Linum tenue]
MEWQQPCDHFFRIILHSTMTTKKLRLAKLFVETRLDELSETVTLKTPNSEAWTIGLTVNNVRRNKTPEAWLDAGFGEFLESLSISYGHFLVFEYRGWSTFKVAVYDKTTCEILYPPRSNDSPMAESEEESRGGTEEHHNDEESDDDDDGGVLFMGTSFLSPRDGSSSSSAKARPQETAAEMGTVAEWDALLNEMMESNIETCHKAFTFLKMPLRSKEAVRRAIARPPANPSAILVLSSYAPYLPGEFSRRYLGRADMKGYGSWMKFEVAGGGGGGRQWPVLIRPHYAGVVFGKYWINFSTDNGLVEGDVCLFEFISFKVLKVHIFRASV